MSSARSLGAQALITLTAAGPMSRAELGDRLGLSPPTTTRTVRPLLDAGVVAEQAPQERTGPGRPTKLLTVVADSAAFLGIKLTTERLYAVLTDPSGAVVDREALPLEGADVDSVVGLIARVAARRGPSRRRPEAIGISLGASVVAHRIVKVASFLGWKDVPLADLVHAATGIACTVANDVRAFACAEARFGEGRDKDPFALVTLGAGIGCGIVVAGEVVAGARGAAGSVGHLPLAEHGPRCELGHVGCARALASTAGITASLGAVLGREVSIDEALGPGLSGHPGVRQVLRRAARAAGTLVGALIAFIEPELTMVSGEGVEVVEAHHDAFTEEVSRLRHWAASPAPVLLRPFEFDEWARGAAALALEQWAESVSER